MLITLRAGTRNSFFLVRKYLHLVKCLHKWELKGLNPWHKNRNFLHAFEIGKWVNWGGRRLGKRQDSGERLSSAWERGKRTASTVVAVRNWRVVRLGIFICWLVLNVCEVCWPLPGSNSSIKLSSLAKELSVECLLCVSTSWAINLTCVSHLICKTTLWGTWLYYIHFTVCSNQGTKRFSTPAQGRGNTWSPATLQTWYEPMYVCASVCIVEMAGRPVWVHVIWNRDCRGDTQKAWDGTRLDKKTRPLQGNSELWAKVLDFDGL